MFSGGYSLTGEHGMSMVGGVWMPNSLCRDVGHAWKAMMVRGWFRCTRLGCGVCGVCPSCVFCVPKGAIVLLCEGHQGVQSTHQVK